MPTLVVPFRAVEGKSRLSLPTPSARAMLARGMLADVIAACLPVGATFVVAAEPVRSEEVTTVADPGGGQGPAVRAGLDAAVAAGCGPPFLVVNADLPCLVPRDLYALAGAVPEGGIALVEAPDGTTNALALASVDLFAPVYGPRSAERFRDLAPWRSVETPNLVDDVDTIADLERLALRLGPATRRAFDAMRLGAAA